MVFKSAKNGNRGKKKILERSIEKLNEMKLEELNNEANEAWQKIVQHETNNVDLLLKISNDKEFRKLFDDYQYKRNKAIAMREKIYRSDRANNIAFFIFIATVIIALIYKSNL